MADTLGSTATVALATRRFPIGGGRIASGPVTAAIKALNTPSRDQTIANWVSAVAALTTGLRPDLSDQLRSHLDAEASEANPLANLSIGEIGVVYEALIALSDHKSRREQGQYFTPDDVARFMAEQTSRFPHGRWLDPCCGVGNLSFHLAGSASNPAEFVRERLTLLDLDAVALKTAIALLVTAYADEGDEEALVALAERSHNRDFLSSAPLPSHDFVIVNPPYARAARLDGYETGIAGELYAYFLERVIKESSGFVAITPASHLGGSKYAPLRELLSARGGGFAFVFDNVPDTCFRGYKYGSTNSSKTNFVRAAITVSSPDDTEWMVTPILRWAARSRARMWAGAKRNLVPLRKGPGGEWAKVMPGTERLWDHLAASHRRLSDLISRTPTEYPLHVASTPRYYISASKRDLDRGSKHVLWFGTESDRESAYLILNSSLPYWWWRCIDGGITLPLRTLLSTPIPKEMPNVGRLARRLEMSEQTDLVTKLNAGRQNENIRRPRALVEEIDAALFAGVQYDFSAVFAPDMFARREHV